MEYTDLLTHLKLLAHKRGSGRAVPVMGDRAIGAAHGSGFEFDTLRGYQEGDDIRRIDWSSSARTNSLMTRAYREQKHRACMVLLDVSASMDSSTTPLTRWQLAARIGQAISAFSSSQNDLCGVATIDTRQELGNVHRPSALTLQHHRVMELCKQPRAVLHEAPHTTLVTAVRTIRPGTQILLITDGFQPEYQAAWHALSLRTPLAIVRLQDPLEQATRIGGMLQLQDPEVPHASYLVSRRTHYTAVHEGIQRWYRQQADFCLRRAIGLCTWDSSMPLHTLAHFLTSLL